MDGLSPELLRAARLSGLPGVTLATACERFGVKKSTLQRARKQLGATWLRPSREDLVLAVLTDYATTTAAPLPADLEAMASYVDFVEKDGCTAAEVRVLLDDLIRRKVIAVTRTRWKLLQPWPFI
jgi:transposase-like protein